MQAVFERIIGFGGLEAGETNHRAAVAQFETGLLRRALEEGRFNQKRAAELLGLSYHQLRGLLRKYRLLDAEAAQPTTPNSAGTRA